MAPLTPTQTLEAVREAGLIAIIRGAFSPPALQTTAEALLRGGVRVLEVTLNSAEALEGVARLRRLLAEHALVGAGTVRTVAEVDAALAAGAQFLVAPNLELGSVARAQEGGALLLPGVFTPSEAQAAHAAGAPAVKLFPADALGPAYLKALRAPLNDITFVPTGGIDASNLAAYVQAGAAAFGVGSALVRHPDEAPEALTERARQLVGALQRAREAL